MKRILVASIVMFASALALLAFGLWDRSRVVNEITHRNCVQIEELKSEIRDQLAQSIRDLPKVAYFRDHPDELLRQRNQLARSVDRFRPLHCS